MAKKGCTFTSVDKFIAAQWPHHPAKGSLRAPVPNDLIAHQIDCLQKLERLARSAIGQAILVIHRRETFDGCVGFGYAPRPEDYTIKSTLLLGIVQPPGVIIRTTGNDVHFPRIQITTKQYVMANDMMINRSVQIFPDNIGGHHGELLGGWDGLDTPIETRNPFNSFMKYPYTEIVAGDAAITAWAKKHGTELFIREAGKKLGHSFPGEAIDEHVAKERARHAHEVEMLWVRTVILRNRIAEITQQIRVGGHPAFSADDPIAIDIVAHNDQEELARAEQQLREHLEQLIEYGIDAATPNAHIIRHVAERLNIPLPS